MITSGGVDGHADRDERGTTRAARGPSKEHDEPVARIAGIKPGPLTYNRIAITDLCRALIATEEQRVALKDALWEWYDGWEKGETMWYELAMRTRKLLAEDAPRLTTC